MSMRLFELMLKAAGYTVALSFAAILIGLVIGIVVCAAKLSPRAWLRWPAATFVSFFRGRASTGPAASDLQPAAHFGGSLFPAWSRP